MMSSTTLITVALELALVATWTSSSAKIGNTKQHAKSLSKKVTHLRQKSDAFVQSLSFHAKTIHLFTTNDFKTILIPWTLFGIAHALSARLFNIAPQSVLAILSRTPLVVFWVAINLLGFNIGNQRLPLSIEEDRINKPYRPMPSGRVTTDQAFYYLIAVNTFSFIVSTILGGVKPWLAIVVMSYIYNDLGGSNKSWVSRNLLNGFGLVAFGWGAMEVAMGQNLTLTPELAKWLSVIVLIDFLSVHCQDIYDQEGDKAIGRVTVPLVIGEEAARWSIVIAVLVCSVAAPWYWSLSWMGYLPVVVEGFGVSFRCLMLRTIEQDRKTYKVWNLWMMIVVCLPLLKTLGA